MMESQACSADENEREKGEGVGERQRGGGSGRDTQQPTTTLRRSASRRWQRPITAREVVRLRKHPSGGTTTHKVAHTAHEVVREREGDSELDEGVQHGVLLEVVHVVPEVVLGDKGRDGECRDACNKEKGATGGGEGQKGMRKHTHVRSQSTAKKGPRRSAHSMRARAPGPRCAPRDAPPVMTMPVPRNMTEVIMFERNL
jgi:hypothetical protein